MNLGQPIPLVFFSSSWSGIEPLGLVAQIFMGPDVLPIARPSVSKH